MWESRSAWAIGFLSGTSPGPASINRGYGSGVASLWCVHTQLQGPMKAAERVGTIATIIIVVSVLGHQQEPGPTAGTLAVTGPWLSACTM